MVGPADACSSHFAKASYINENPTVKNVVAAFNEANAYANAHPDSIRSIIPTYTSISAGIASKIQIGYYATGLDAHLRSHGSRNGETRLDQESSEPDYAARSVTVTEATGTSWRVTSRHRMSVQSDAVIIGSRDVNPRRDGTARSYDIHG